MQAIYYELCIAGGDKEALLELAFSLGASAVEERAEGLILRDEDKEALEAILWGLGEFASQMGWGLKTSISERQNRDWIEEYRRSIRPVVAGRFYVRPSWERPAGERPFDEVGGGGVFGGGSSDSAKNGFDSAKTSESAADNAAAGLATSGTNSSAHATAAGLAASTAGLAKGDLIDIIIDPALAFGSGHHESTNSCLHLISQYFISDEVASAADAASVSTNITSIATNATSTATSAADAASTKTTKTPTPLNAAKTALDVGCGSGILSIALAKIGFITDACDTDDQAVASTAQNAVKNGIKLNDIICGSITDIAGKQYDLVAANIIADVILMLSNELRAALKDGGYLLISGILDRYEGRILEAFGGLELIQKRATNEWLSFIFKKECDGAKR